jgi:UDP-N-acetylglucosamine 2-epimerase (non-hydrolysing)
MALRGSDALQRFGMEPRRYALLTMHREENVDVYENLRGALDGVAAAAQALQMPVLFLAHPRTLKRLAEFAISEWAASLPLIRMIEAVGYLDFLTLLTKAALVFTDSGGVQQESCIHRIPCVTLRDNTEWMETIEIGANRLAGCEPERIVAAAREAASATVDWPVPFGDGTAARRIVDVAERVIAGYGGSAAVAQE